MANEKPKGFSYTLEDEKLIAYAKLTTEEKLEWLEEIFNLNILVRTEKDWEIVNKFRNAEI